MSKSTTLVTRPISRAKFSRTLQILPFKNNISTKLETMITEYIPLDFLIEASFRRFIPFVWSRQAESKKGEDICSMQI